METYQRVLLTRYGDPDVLQPISEIVPNPGPGEVCVRVEAAGVAYADVLMRRGLYPNSPRVPFVPGYDICGVVEALGDNVTELPVGQRVAAITGTGGYAQMLTIPAWRCVTVPDGVDPLEAASLPLNYVTAYQMLHRVALVSKREKILVHGAAGGTGTALLQLGGLAGLKLYGTASRGKHDVVREYGGKPIDYQREDFVERVLTLSGDGVDVVFDPIGGEHFLRSYRSLRFGGTLVMYGLRAALVDGERRPARLLPATLALGLRLFVPDGRRAVPYFIDGTNLARTAYREDLTELLQLLADGDIQPLIGAKVPLRQAAHAHAMLENSETVGKIVLLCD